MRILPGVRVLRRERATAVPRLPPGFVELGDGGGGGGAVDEAGAVEACHERRCTPSPVEGWSPKR